MKTENEVVTEYRNIKEDYAFNPSIFSNENEKVARLKYIIDNRLSVVDKTIILLYAECSSYRKLGEKMRMSHMTCRKEVLRIRDIILQEYERIH